MFADLKLPIRMERSNRIAQMYGYAVCLIAVVTILISANKVIDSAFDLSEPLRAEQYGGRGYSLTSFESYQRDRTNQGVPRQRPEPAMAEGTAATPPSPLTDAELRQMYQDERNDQIGNVKFRATRSLVSSLLMMLIASVLFLTHWRWLRRQTVDT